MNAMKIIYNPFFTERLFMGNQRLFNQVVLNTRGLLAELELRAGLTAVFPSSTERIVAYINAMQMAIQQEGSHQLFFENSFMLDKYGTAKIILDWRDKLIYAGWNSGVLGSEKLDGLAAVEQHFQAIGESDRWQRLLLYAQKNSILTQNDTIEVTTLKSYLDATLTKLLDAIEMAGTPVFYTEKREEGLISIPIYHHHFYTDTDAHTWITQQQLKDNDVIVGFDNAMLADLAILSHRPSVASNEVGVGQQMQMLSLGLALFKKPINAQYLLDYLRLPQSPLRSVYHECESKDGSKTYLRPLSEVLKEILLNGGVDEAWREELQKTMVDCAREKMECKREEVLAFVNMWEKSFVKDGKCVAHKADVIAFVTHLCKWAAQRQHRQDSTDAQFVALTSACNEMLMLLETQPDVIVVDDIIQWSRQIAQPAVLSEAEAIIGSPNTVDSPTDIYANPDKVYWLCSTIAPAEDMFAFLGEKDRNSLKQADIKVPDKGSNVVLLQKEIFANFQKAKEIHLVSCDIRHGDAAMLNDVAMQLLNKVSASSDTTIGLEQNDVIGIAKPQETYIIDPAKIKAAVAAYGGHLREKESYSSLNTLIQTPFEYVLQYILNLRAYQSESLSDINTVKGNVAHAYIEWLINENNKDVHRMQAVHQSNYDANIDTVIGANGILLLQENNQLDMMLFKSQLKESVNVLLNILKSNKLTIVGSEYWAETNIAGIGQMDAKVDLLLEKKGELYIIDFKWNEGSTYTKKLENNLALQLAVYKNVLKQAEGRDVVFCGYYILPKHQLLTHDSGVLSDSNIETVEPENDNDIFQQAIHSYNYRKEQLLNGIIEEAEQLPLANLQYMQDSVAKDLYPLETDYSDHNLKGTPYGKPNKVLKGQLQ